MVITNPLVGARLKILITVAILAGVLYYASDIVPIFYRSWALEDRMKTAARFAQGESVQWVRNRALHEMDNLGMPDEARRRLVVQALSNPARIQITTRYSESVDLPFLQHTWTFSPSAVAPL